MERWGEPGKGAERRVREQLLERLIWTQHSNDSPASSNQTLVSDGWQWGARVHICVHGKLSKERTKKQKRKEEEWGKESKPVVWCECAVRCHCEYLWHLWVAIGIMEDAERQGRFPFGEAVLRLITILQKAKLLFLLIIKIRLKAPTYCTTSPVCPSWTHADPDCAYVLHSRTNT